MLASQLAHVRIIGPLHRVRVRTFQVRPLFLQQTHAEVDAVLLLWSEAVPPESKLICELDLPRHDDNYGPECIMQSTPYLKPFAMLSVRFPCVNSSAVVIFGGANLHEGS